VRFELTTYSFGGCRSIHLSYGRTIAYGNKAAETDLHENRRWHHYFSACAHSAP
jgi:hypothetical protein